MGLYTMTSLKTFVATALLATVAVQSEKVSALNLKKNPDNTEQLFRAIEVLKTELSCGEKMKTDTLQEEDLFAKPLKPMIFRTYGKSLSYDGNTELFKVTKAFYDTYTKRYWTPKGEKEYVFKDKSYWLDFSARLENLSESIKINGDRLTIVCKNGDCMSYRKNPNALDVDSKWLEEPNLKAVDIQFCGASNAERASRALRTLITGAK